MITFKQYLTESTNLPTDPRKIFDLTYYFYDVGQFLVDWFFGRYMKVKLYSGDETIMIEKILETREYIPNYEMGPSKMYRVYHESHLLQFLDVKEQSEYKAKRSVAKKQQILIDKFQDKHIALNTGINKLQSWTGDYSNIDKFHQFLNADVAGKIFVVVESDFTPKENLFYQPNQEKFGDFIIKELPTIATTLRSDSKFSDGTIDSITKDLSEMAVKLKKSGSGFDNGNESIVDTTLPRKVTVKKVFISQ